MAGTIKLFICCNYFEFCINVYGTKEVVVYTLENK
jgi:hypothetical protein